METIFKWTQRQRDLLRLERDEEQSQVADAIAQLSAQECVERGVSLLPLEVKGISTGLYGRACVSVADPKDRPLPAHRFSAGDEVRLYSSKGSKGGTPDEGSSEITGVVGKVTERMVEVLSDDVDNAESLRPPLRLDVVASVATHKKLMLVLDALERYPGGGPAERLINVLFGVERPSTVAPSTGFGAGGVPSALSRLNDSQRDAVEFALATRDVALIHGPPGTGKTTTVVALVLEAVARGWRCLVCAPSNVAVDGILERLVVEGRKTDGRSNGRRRVRVVRMGHPARLLPQVVEHSLEAIISQHEGTAIVKDIRGEIDALVRRLYPAVDAGGTKSRGWLRPGDRKSAREELKSLRKEARSREDRVVQEVLKSRDVVLATCVGAATHSLRDEEFDLVVIDEAAQALEAACWIPILKGKRLVLAGDHKQLAPTVKSRKATEGGRLDQNASVGPSESADGVGDGLGLTMFDRVLRDVGSGVCRMLDVQYRMNRDICDWASNEMYGGLLQADPSVAERTLPGLPHASKADDMAASVMLLLDTSGCDMHEEEAGGGSRRNEREAGVAVRHVKNLLEAGLLETEVAVISPYNGQVNLLKSLLRPKHSGVEVRSVDGFQGGEKEAIVLSLVRSNEGRRVGFLADARRLNVAVTRAKRHVAVVCDAECCGSDAFIGRLLRHIEEKGEHRSALELVDAGAFEGSTSVQEASPIVRQGGRRDVNDRNLKGVKRSSNSSLQVDYPKISDEDVFALVETFSRESRPCAPSCSSSSAGDGIGVEEVSRLELPVEVTSRQRALVHDMAEGLGLGHASKGEGPNRVLVLSHMNRPGKAKVAKGMAKPVREVTSVNIEEQATELKESAAAGENSDHGPSAATMSSPRDFQRLPCPGSVEDGDRSLELRLRSISPGSARVESATVHPPRSAEGGTSACVSGAPKSPGGIQGGSNALLASLHAERAARRGPPVASSATKGNNKKGGAREGASSTLDDRGFAVEIAGATLGSGGGITSKKKSSSRRGASSKKGRQKKGTGAGVERTVSAGGSGGSTGRGSKDDGDDEDDEMAFLDAQIKAQRDSEPCYASLLRSTTAAMRENNPAWAAAQDKGRPSRSEITRARRTQLQGALQSRLAQDEKRRGKASGRGEESK